MASNDPGVAGDRLVCLIDGVAPDDERSASKPCLRIDNGISADNSGPARDAAGNVEIPEEDEDVSREIAFHLY
jgi:hypothetical protein